MEYPQNLLMTGTEPWNKWVQISTNRASVFIDYNTPLVYSGFGFRAANDAEWRDPTIITVSFWDASRDNWVKITEVYPKFTSRWQQIDYVT